MVKNLENTEKHKEKNSSIFHYLEAATINMGSV